MKFDRRRDDHALMIGIVQDRDTAWLLLKRLRRLGFHRATTIWAASKGKPQVEESRVLTTIATVLVSIIGALIAALSLWYQWFLPGGPPALVVQVVVAAALSGAVAGWVLCRLIAPPLDRASVSWCTRLVLPNEAFVLAEVKTRDAARALEVLRAEEESPVTFAFHPMPPFPAASVRKWSWHQNTLAQHLSENAIRLARLFAIDSKATSHGPAFLRLLEDTQRSIESANASLTMSAEVHRAFTISAEWLLDNAYIIREQVADLRKSLPQRQYGNLPLIASGPGAGEPRIYRLAGQIVADSGGALELENVKKFLVAFQIEMPLTIAETWAVPLMLRLCLLESLSTLAIQVEQEQSQSEQAAFWANRLTRAIRHSPARSLRMMEHLVEEHPEPTAYFASELVAHLYDNETALPLATGWLERSLHAPLLELIQQEQRRQAGQQTALAKMITSCRRLAQTQWREFFQSISYADKELSNDPGGVYARSSFETRDRYRNAVEEIARWSKCSEQEAIQQALALAKPGDSEVTCHVGYYLVDEGRPALERVVRAKVPIIERVRRSLRAHGTGFYFAAVLVLWAVMVVVPLIIIHEWGHGLTIGIFALLLVIPASELAVLVVNYFVTSFLRPELLPRMSFEKNGIPNDYGTLVAVPMLLTMPEAIKNELARLEIRYLGNPDANLRFSLLTDFADAPQQSMPEDAEYLDLVVRGIEELNRRYGAGRFFLFHRQRAWSETEQRWMGWERKRGKLEQLNRFLLGDASPEIEAFLYSGDRAQLQGIRFVITLDADTQLLRGTARQLIETLAHPLNQARLSADGKHIVRGYTIIQPGVSTTLPSATATWFSRIFADPRGVDPYTHAVSDIYQDLIREASYHGKGIYDLKIFNQILAGRFPKSHLLSHDLLEGCYVRVGLATDIELLDAFPDTYIAWWNRQHRWIRGDWQIIDWLGRRVPSGAAGKEVNPLSAFSRWKIFDNVRRSLVPAASIVLLAAGWLFTAKPIVWSLIIAGLMLWPALNSVIGLILHPPPPGTRWWREPGDRLLRSVFTVMFLPDYMAMAFDAIGRVAYRRRISHRYLLEWETAQDAHQRARSRQRQFVLERLWIPAGCILLFAATALRGPITVAAMGPFLLLWALFPLAVIVIDQSARSWRGGILLPPDREFLRTAARRTWRYFAEFIGPTTSWLPPDNVQETPKREVFMRTSPTNIGLSLLASAAANDFGYIPIDDVIARSLETLKTISQLERFEGHLFNWYDIATLEPLHPRYVSTVDSGNLLASLWTLERVCHELPTRALLDATALQGIADTLNVLRQGMTEEKEIELPAAFFRLQKLTANQSPSLEEIILRLRAARQPAKDLLLFFQAAKLDSLTYWAEQVMNQVQAWNHTIDQYLRPVEMLTTPPGQLMSLGERAHECRRAALTAKFSLRNIATDAIPGLLPLLACWERRDDSTIPAPVAEWLEQLASEVQQARKRAAEEIARLDELLATCKQTADEMGLRFLYDPERRIFAIGYQVAERRLDTSFYDLLASEARLTSFLAIARGDAPVEHWWALGRPFGSAYGRLPVLSWSGTMFEYLMPLLFTRIHENSLLDHACQDAVRCQIGYAKQNAIPWGISESAFSALDRHNVYQYRAFGVPALALRRGHDSELVVAPYATGLALGVQPVAATRNLRRLARLDHADLFGDYGYYEAIDYSRRTEPGGEAGIIIHCYMVHHQGMSLIAYDNALHDGVMQKRFHSDPRVRATEPLLYERVPEQILPTTEEVYEPRPIPHLLPRGATTVVTQTAETTTPRAHLLSNGSCSFMVTNSGGGYLRWRDLDVTRWRADPTTESPSVICYLRDLESGTIWSDTHQPIPSAEKRYTWSFTPDKAEFRRRSGPCETWTEVAVSAEDDAEVRRVTVINTSRRVCRIELTSYLELALAPHNSDKAHPAFNKLFIETEWLPNCEALIATRRLRAPDEQPIWAAHLMVPNRRARARDVDFETDREQFVGRGRTLQHPEALTRDLTRRLGAVLDPIFSLRRRVTLLPNERIQFAFVTLLADSRDAILALAARYSEFHTCARTFETAWTHSRLEMRRLHIRPADVQTFQQLATYVVFPQAQLRPPAARLARRGGGQRSLWRQGISGDLPIVVVMIGHLRDIEIVREILTAHTFWHLRGLKADLVLINEAAESYDDPLTNALRQLTEARAHLTGVDQPGGIYLRSANKMSKDELVVIQAAARMVLIAARGTLDQQLAASAPIKKEPRLLITKGGLQEEPSAPLPFLKLRYFNELGGFTGDGKEYAIYLGPNRETPRPWVNIMANPNLGSLISESGAEFVWAGNSQTDRLTPWFNDPISDPTGSIIYIRDDDIKVCWSPTAKPIREKDAYRARHGQGYTIFEHNSHAIEQELLTFVPVNNTGGVPVRIQRLRLRNRSSRRRRLTIMSYSDLVLGSDPEETHMHIVTKWDLQSQALFARNCYEPELCDRVAFITSMPQPISFTGDRASFIGRNRSLTRPAAMEHERLNVEVGPGLDPCAAVQVAVEIEPDNVTEVIFLIGQASGEEQARSLIKQFRDRAHVEATFRETEQWWDDFLGTIQVETPDAATNFLLNRWLLYQVLSCRIWGRTALYQSSGAYGFRDQLQDSMAVMHAAPRIAREHILRAAGRQFVEGDVQHWWHPESGVGVRTRISDDLLWLPFVTAQYVRVTGDAGILDETVPFVEGKPLEKNQAESLSIPTVGHAEGSLLEHCRRAIAHSTGTGPHGLPLIGGGDWNDGLNRVGIAGKGESVWLGWFQICVLNDFAELLLLRDCRDEAQACRARAGALREAIEREAWDGDWYRRGYLDDGSPLGSKECAEAKIDSLPQTWAVISGVADPVRVEVALRAVEDHLVREPDSLILLLAPPFDTASPDVGYIKAYPPGIRENGGQYSHAAVWVAQAFARRGEGDKAVQFLRMLNPIEHAAKKEGAERYKIEPYVIAGDIYASADFMGRGGWSWYTGAAGWLYRVWIEEVLGFQRRDDELMINPVLPKDWDHVRLRYRYGKTLYRITIENPQHCSRGVALIEVDGAAATEKMIRLQDDTIDHEVRVVLGTQPTSVTTPQSPGRAVHEPRV